MSKSKVLTLAEPTGTMTLAEGLAFIERTRRQLDRFDLAIPHTAGKSIDLQEAEAIRRICDEVEEEINAMLGRPLPLPRRRPSRDRLRLAISRFGRRFTLLCSRLFLRRSPSMLTRRA